MGSDYPSSAVDDDAKPEDQELLEILRPVVRQILGEMSEGLGGRSPDELTRWQRLVGAVCDQLVDTGEIHRAAVMIVVEQLQDLINERIDFVLRWRWTGEMRTLDLLVAQGEVYLRVKEAASIASCSERSIRRALESKALPRFRNGKDPRIKLADLRKWLAEGRQIGAEGAVSTDGDGGEPDGSADRQPES